MTSHVTIKRRAFSLALAVLPVLSGCTGLTPLYARSDQSNVTPALAAIDIQTPRGRQGQLLLESLSSALNPDDLSVPADYVLKVALKRKSEALAIQLDDTETRFDLLIEARYALVAIGEAEPIFDGIASQVSSYNVVAEPFATLASEQDSERRAMEAIAIQVRNQLALYFGSIQS